MKEFVLKRQVVMLQEAKIIAQDKEDALAWGRSLDDWDWDTITTTQAPIDGTLTSEEVEL